MDKYAYRNVATIVVVIVSTAFFTGCATTGETARQGEQVQREQIVRLGVVENVQEVQIENTRRSTGAGRVAPAGTLRSS